MDESDYGPGDNKKRMRCEHISSEASIKGLTRPDTPALEQVGEQAGYIDAHCHLADPQLDGRREALIKQAAAVGILGFIQGGVGPDDWDRQLSLSQISPGRWYLAFGIHPWWVAAHDDAACQQALLRLPSYLSRGVGLGELGLDHGPRCPTSSYERQMTVFEAQLHLAREARKPVILHIVKAHGQAIEVLRKHGTPTAGGIVHSFSGTPAQAKGYRDLGLHISIGTGVLRKGFENLKRTVVSMPLDWLVVETDAPDQPPPLPLCPNSMNINEPVNLRKVAEAIGALRGISETAVLDQSRENLRKIFNI